ncbi:MAG: glycosyltransferase family 4 protein [Bacteroidales bacterium]|nr:glycosyltransferase family 4 protein [Bacteroidales bacterium]
MRIIAAHLLNNYTGSPRVLAQLARAWINAGLEVHLLTSRATTGFLSDIEGARLHSNHYGYSKPTILRLIRFTYSQLVIFWKLLITVHQHDTVYINTAYPFAAAIAGRIKGCRVIFHLHETSIHPVALKQFLRWIIRLTASEIIYVSEYLRDAEPFDGKITHVISNCLDGYFATTAELFNRDQSAKTNVLMVASLRPYKGISEFVELARINPHLRFKLVLSESEIDVESYSRSIHKPENLELHSTTNNLHPYYQWADIVLNLSKPERWIETFGLTILEGMAYGLPAIVPTVGGIVELIDDGVNGFCINSSNVTEISEKINLLFTNENIYHKFSAKARSKARQYNESILIRKNLEILLNQ